MAKINRITRSSSSLVTLAELQSGSQLFSKTTVARTQITPELTGTAALVKRAEVIRRVIDRIVYNDTVSGVQIFAEYLLPVDSPLLLFIRGRFVDDVLGLADIIDVLPGKGFNEILSVQEQIKILISVFRVFEDAVLLQSRTALRLDKPLPDELINIADLPSLEPGLNIFEALQATELSQLLVAFARTFEDVVTVNEDIQSLDVTKLLQDQFVTSDRIVQVAAKSLSDLIFEFDVVAQTLSKPITESVVISDAAARQVTLNRFENLSTADRRVLTIGLNKFNQVDTQDITTFRSTKLLRNTTTVLDQPSKFVVLSKRHAVVSTDRTVKFVGLNKQEQTNVRDVSRLISGLGFRDIVGTAEFTTNRILKVLSDRVIPQDLAGVFDGITYNYGLSRTFSVAATDSYRSAARYFRRNTDALDISDFIVIAQLFNIRFADIVIGLDQSQLQINKGIRDTAVPSDLLRRITNTNRVFEDVFFANDLNRFSVATRKSDAISLEDFLVALVFKLLTVEDTQSVLDARVRLSVVKGLSEELQSQQRIFKNVGKRLTDDTSVDDFRSSLIAKLLRDTVIPEDLAGVFDGITYSYGLSRTETLLSVDRFFRTFSAQRVFEDIVEPADFFRRVYERPARFEDLQGALDLLSLEPGKGFSDNVGDFFAFTAGYQDLLWDRVTGQAFTSSTLFTTTSVSAGVQVTSSGTAAGQFDGFYAPAIPAIGPIPGSPAGGNYVQFAGTGTRFLATVPLDLTFTSAESVTFSYIVGSNFNGGDRPDVGENLVLEYSINQEASYVTASTIWIAANVWPDGANWRTTSIAIPAAAKTASTIWRWRQTGSPVVAADAYGLFAIYIGTTSVTEVRTIPEKSVLTIGKGFSESVSQTVSISRVSRNRYTDRADIIDLPADFFSKVAKQGVNNNIVVKTIEVSNNTGLGTENSSVTLTRTSASTDLVGTVDLLKRILAANKVTDLQITTADSERADIGKGLTELVVPAPGGVGRRIISGYSSVSQIVVASTSVTSSTSLQINAYTTSEISMFDIFPVVGVFTNSLIWASSIGVIAKSTGGGSGTAGFGTYEHFDFNSGGARILTSYLIPGFSSLSLRYIAGNNTNGGDTPEVGENLIVEYNTTGNSWITATTLRFGGSSTATNWTLTSINLSLGNGNTRIRIRQTSNSGSETDNYGVATTEVTGSRTSVAVTFSTSITTESRLITSTGIYSDPVEVGEVALDVDLRVYRGVDGSTVIKTQDGTVIPNRFFLQSSVTINRGARSIDDVGVIDEWNRQLSVVRSPTESVTTADRDLLRITKEIFDPVSVEDSYSIVTDGLTYNSTKIIRDLLSVGLGDTRRVSDSDLERVSFQIIKNELYDTPLSEYGAQALSTTSTTNYGGGGRGVSFSGPGGAGGGGIVLISSVSAVAFTTALTTSGVYSWIPPVGVTEINVICTGGGGGGENFGTGGGGGGTGAIYNLTVTPGVAYPIVVGSAGQGGDGSTVLATPGTASYFSSTSTLVGFGGGAGIRNLPNSSSVGGSFGGAGGTGGRGGFSGRYIATGGGGSGGGGAGGLTGNGGNGGDGGDNAGSNGTAGTSGSGGGGGGGGGGSDNFDGGNGGGVFSFGVYPLVTTNGSGGSAGTGSFFGTGGNGSAGSPYIGGSAITIRTFSRQRVVVTELPSLGFIQGSRIDEVFLGSDLDRAVTQLKTEIAQAGFGIAAPGMRVSGDDLERTAFDISLRAYRGVDGSVTLNTIDPSPDVEYQVSSVTVNRGARSVDEVGTLDSFFLTYAVGRLPEDFISVGRNIDDGIRRFTPAINPETVVFAITKLIRDTATPDDFLQTFDGLTYRATILLRDNVSMGTWPALFGLRVSGTDLERIALDFSLRARQGANNTVSGVTIAATALGEFVRVGQQSFAGNTLGRRNSGDGQERTSFSIIKGNIDDVRAGVDYDQRSTNEERLRFTVSKRATVGSDPVVMGFGGTNFGARVSDSDLERTAFNVTMRAYRGVVGTTELNTIDSNPDIEYRVSSVAVFRGARSGDDVGTLDSFFLTYAIGRIINETVTAGIGIDPGYRFFNRGINAETVSFAITKRIGDDVIPDDFLQTFDGLTYRATMLERDTVLAGLNIAPRVSGSDLERTPFSITMVMKQGANNTVSGVTIAAAALGETVRVGQQSFAGNVLGRRNSGDGQERTFFTIGKGISSITVLAGSPSGARNSNPDDPFSTDGTQNTSAETIRLTVGKRATVGSDPVVMGFGGANFGARVSDSDLERTAFNVTLVMKQGTNNTVSGVTRAASATGETVRVGQQYGLIRFSRDDQERIAFDYFKSLPAGSNNTVTVALDNFRSASAYRRPFEELLLTLGEKDGNFRYALNQGARIEELTAADSVVVSNLLFRTLETVLQQGDLDPFGNINTMVSNGSLRMTDYVDIEYLENDYVGESRSFS